MLWCAFFFFLTFNYLSLCKSCRDPPVHWTRLSCFQSEKNFVQFLGFLHIDSWYFIDSDDEDSPFLTNSSPFIQISASTSYRQSITLYVITYGNGSCYNRLFPASELFRKDIIEYSLSVPRSPRPHLFMEPSSMNERQKFLIIKRTWPRLSSFDK